MVASHFYTDAIVVVEIAFDVYFYFNLISEFIYLSALQNNFVISMYRKMQIKYLMKCMSNIDESLKQIQA